MTNKQIFIAKQQTLFITGGHLTPALAIIDELQNKKEWEIFFIGRKHSLEGDAAISVEYKVITELKIPFLELITGRLQRTFTLYTLISILKIPLGILQSFYYLFKYKPDVILSFGGYIALPVAISGFLLKIPIITHEQTVKAGLANRFIGFLAKKICISYPSSQKYFPAGKTILTGNPLRSEIWRKTKAAWQKNILQPLLYITGGSLGAQGINKLIIEIIDELLENFYVVHQTGESKSYQDFEELKNKKKFLPVNLRKRYYLKPYLDRSEIGWVLNKADLIISRAGANTVSEIIALGKPAIFIPLPYVSEQKENALMAKNFVSAKILEQEKLTPAMLLAVIKETWKKIKIEVKKAKKKQFFGGIGKKEASSQIIKEIYAVTK